MRIEQLSVHEIGPFQDLEMSFPAGSDPAKADVHILVGQNGSGKSTILRVLAQFLTPNPVLGRRWWGDRSYAIASLDGAPRQAIAPWTGETGALSTHRGQILLQDHSYRVGFYGDGGFPLRAVRHAHGQGAIGSEGAESAAFAYGGYRSMEPARLTAISELSDGPLTHSLSFEESADTGRLMQWIAITRTKEALALQRHDVAAAQRRRDAMNLIERTLSEVIGSDVRFDLREDPLDVLLSVNGEALSFDLLPDGLRALLAWIGDLLMRMDRLVWKDDPGILNRPFFLFLDEVEVHLHPAWQRRVLPVVQSLFPKAQVFLSTHSPHVVASAGDAWIHPLVFENGRPRALDPIPSRRGHSYSAILSEVFGVDEEFDIETENQLAEFRALRDRRLAGDESVEARIQEIGAELAAVSPELSSIVGREMRQLKRHLTLRPGEPLPA